MREEWKLLYPLVRKEKEKIAKNIEEIAAQYSIQDICRNCYTTIELHKNLSQGQQRKTMKHIREKRNTITPAKGNKKHVQRLGDSHCWKRRYQEENEPRRTTRTAEMKFQRRTAGYTRRDRKRNTEIRRELQIQSINERLQEYRTAWTNHLDRMDHTRIPKKTFIYKPKGRRPLGRPKKKWKDQLS
ncbi:hypothetical protein ILUMI_08184 [Ignelater luminosus]|uniref:Uncharacterized protein n=1 Tax=Ignelater luminosus TaxID=2038154 RepID=A0A8K0D6K7_IGNLU|nr:hypothetical protein ILUMI_08184 [Ignelater luminosus]